MISRTKKRRLEQVLHDLKATPFQKKVWEVLLTIPAGQVRSYSWVAREAGSPRAARAVGNALKRNPLAPDIPCHRVIRSDGTLGGYSGRGGIRAKIRLLRREGE